jgi:glutamyl-tRNA synthetase
LALKKRGITPEAVKKMIIDVGPKTSDIILSWENLYAYNRKILDPKADRYFFVHNPVELTVRGIPKMFRARLHLHPDQPERGFREYVIKPQGNDDSAMFWVAKKDINSFGMGTVVRLMELFNVEIESVSAVHAEARFASEAYEEARKAKAQLIHWIPVGEDMPCQVIMPDATMAEGVAESACKQLTPNTIIQFERFGFVRIDEVAAKLTAYYGHK